uniref:Uncharacterized protein n=1 Tax=Salix viminalis TaxID=40686 RepID=A0A6N2L3L0_SALVM
MGADGNLSRVCCFFYLKAKLFQNHFRNLLNFKIYKNIFFSTQSEEYEKESLTLLPTSIKPIIGLHFIVSVRGDHSPSAFSR